MRRTQRAIGSIDMDTYARSIGLKSANEYTEHLMLHRRLDGGGRITAKDIDRARSRDPHIPMEAFNRLADYVNGGATARDRADRYATAVGRSIGAPEHRLASVREQARQEGERLAVVEMADPVTRSLDERDAHRDRANGIDPQSRAEQARRAATMNPDAQRRRDVEREWDRHSGGAPTLYAHERRELFAQGHDGIADRIRKTMVRDADPNRSPDRSDDRREDLRLQYDRHALESLSRDELSLAQNPVLEKVDNAITQAESAERE